MARKSQDVPMGRYACEPAGDWVRLCEHLLREGLERQGNPLKETYVLDAGSGLFVRTGAAGAPPRVGKDAFSLPIFIFDRYSDHDCGEYPLDLASELAAFWQAACDYFERDVLSGRIRVLARRGGWSRPFVPVAVDTWNRGYAQSEDFQSGPMDRYEWMAMCIHTDTIVGSDELLCSLHVACMQTPTAQTDRAPSPMKRKRRRKPPFDWLWLRERFFCLLDEYGDFASDNTELPSMRRAIDRLILEYNLTFGDDTAPTEASIYNKTKPWLDEWRKEKREGKRS